MTLALCRKFLAAATLALFTTSALTQTSPQPGDPIPPTPPVRTPHAMVVTIQHDATDAGVEILRAGGNAVDAAVAVAFALAVTLPAAGNLGGGGFMLIRPSSARLAHGAPHFLDFREKAPAAATRQHVSRRAGQRHSGHVHAGSQVLRRPGHCCRPRLRGGPLRPSGPPPSDGARHPSRRRTASFSPTKRHARCTLPKLAKYPTSRRIFQRDGNFYKGGDRLVQPELARTLRQIAAIRRASITGRSRSRSQPMRRTMAG